MYYICFWQLLDLEMDGLHQTTFTQDILLMLDKSRVTIPDWSLPWTRRSASTDVHKKGGDTSATGFLHQIKAWRETVLQLTP